jgi:hypothetical protein
MTNRINKTRILVASVAAFAAVFFYAPNAHALFSPLGVAILGPVEFPPPSFSIVGARISAIYGEHRDVFGLDVGAVGNVTDVSFVGLAVAGGFNYNRGVSTAVGLQAAGVTNVNINKARVVGVQLAGIANVNKAESSIVGLSLALGNYGPATTVYGFEVGAYNKAHTVNGFQIGIVNVCDQLRGLQIGLVNFNKTGPLAVAPILNVGF